MYITQERFSTCSTREETGAPGKPQAQTRAPKRLQFPPNSEGSWGDRPARPPATGNRDTRGFAPCPLPPQGYPHLTDEASRCRMERPLTHSGQGRENAVFFTVFCKFEIPKLLGEWVGAVHPTGRLCSATPGHHREQQTCS